MSRISPERSAAAAPEDLRVVMACRNPHAPWVLVAWIFGYSRPLYWFRMGVN